MLEKRLKKYITEYEKLTKTFTVSNKITKKTAEYRKFLKRPNIYISLYYVLIIAEYTVPSNCITFFGENKYRLIFKVYSVFY